MLQSYNPHNAETMRVWAVPISLATTQGITIVFFSSTYLDVSVQWVVLRPSLSWVGCPIRRSADLNLLAVPRSFSQLSTSFFVSESLGIPRTPLVTSLN